MPPPKRNEPPPDDDGDEYPDSSWICLVCGMEDLNDTNAVSLSHEARHGIYQICMGCYDKLKPIEKLTMHLEWVKAADQGRALRAFTDLCGTAMDSHDLSALMRPRREDN